MFTVIDLDESIKLCAQDIVFPTAYICNEGLDNNAMSALDPIDIGRFEDDVIKYDLLDHQFDALFVGVHNLDWSMDYNTYLKECLTSQINKLYRGKRNNERDVDGV